MKFVIEEIEKYREKMIKQKEEYEKWKNDMGIPT